MVQRYTVSIDDDGPVCMASDDGDWVDYDDHQKAVAEARRQTLGEIARGIVPCADPTGQTDECFLELAKAFAINIAAARREAREAAIEDCAQAVLEAVKDYYPHAKGPYLHAAEILRDLAKRPGPEGGSCAVDNDDLNDGLDPMEVEG